MGKNPIQNLILRLQGDEESVVLVYERENINIFDTKYIFDLLMKSCSQGTLVISGDSRINQDVTVRRGLRNISNQQRVVISANKLLQLLLLEDDVHFATHPGIIMGSKGKFARFFGRKVDYDFPYGPSSTFNDIYELNAIILFVGLPNWVDCIKLVCSKVDKPILRKNTSYHENELVSYLDYHYDIDSITQKLQQSNILISEELGTTQVYGIRYNDLINFALQNI